MTNCSNGVSGGKKCFFAATAKISAIFQSAAEIQHRRAFQVCLVFSQFWLPFQGEPFEASACLASRSRCVATASPRSSPRGWPAPTRAPRCGSGAGPGLWSSTIPLWGWGEGVGIGLGGGHQLGPPVVPFYRFLFWGEGSPTKIDYHDYRKKLVPTYSNFSEELVDEEVALQDEILLDKPNISSYGLGWGPLRSLRPDGSQQLSVCIMLSSANVKLLSTFQVNGILTQGFGRPPCICAESTRR